jgi:hypothetical protein
MDLQERDANSQQRVAYYDTGVSEPRRVDHYIDGASGGMDAVNYRALVIIERLPPAQRVALPVSGRLLSHWRVSLSHIGKALKSQAD